MPVPKSTRKKTVNQLASETKQIEKSHGVNLLPHEILAKAANGEPFRIKNLVITYYAAGEKKGLEKSREWVEMDYYPNYNEQIDAAKAAAPYYAPKLSAQTIGTDDKTSDALAAVMKELALKLPG